MGRQARNRSLLQIHEAAVSAQTLIAKQISESAAPRKPWSSRAMLILADFDETVSYVYDFMQKNGPFDGIMGFSQGACMAAVLGALVRGGFGR